MLDEKGEGGRRTQKPALSRRSSGDRKVSFQRGPGFFFDVILDVERPGRKYES